MDLVERNDRIVLGIEISTLSSRFQVRKLTEEDLEQVLALYQTNPLYFEYFPPRPSLESLVNDLLDCPPEKNLSDKYFLGFWEKDRLVAVLDLIDAYPTDEVAYVGLFIVDKSYQGRGLGSAIIKEVIANLPSHLITIRLGYVSRNPQSKAFWLKNSFESTRETKNLGGIEVSLMEYHRHI